MKKIILSIGLIIVMSTQAHALTSYQRSLAARNAAARAQSTQVYVAPAPVVYIQPVATSPYPANCGTFSTGMTYGEQLTYRNCIAQQQTTPIVVPDPIVDLIPTVDTLIP